MYFLLLIIYNHTLSIFAKIYFKGQDNFYEKSSGILLNGLLLVNESVLFLSSNLN